MLNTKQKIIDQKIIGIVRGIEKDKILKTVEALFEGGIGLLEITLNQDSREDCLDTVEEIRLVKDEFKDSLKLGAGTVITEEQVEMVVDAGAEYIISPNTDTNIIKKTKDLNKISIPGAYTPSEIIDAYHSGADFVKLFPANSLGSQYMSSVRGPISNIPLLAVGGVGLENLKEFLAAGAVGVGIGGNLVDKNLINKGQYEALTENARKYVKAVKLFNKEIR